MMRLLPMVFAALLTVALCADGIAAPLTSVVYFTGIGCPHCAMTDPVLLRQTVRQSELLVIEYEIYQDSVNAPLIMDYYALFGGRPGIPAMIAGREQGQSIIGDSPILAEMERFIDANRDNGVILPTRSVSVDRLNIAELPGRPKLWFRDRVAVRQEIGSRESEAVKSFVLDGVLPAGSRPCRENKVQLSGDAIVFREAYAFDGWILMRD
jgi:hypothetical protein